MLTEENVENYKRVLKIDGFTTHYKEDVRQEILQFYYANHDLEDLDQEFLVTETTRMTPKDRARYVEIPDSPGRVWGRLGYDSGLMTIPWCG